MKVMLRNTGYFLREINTIIKLDFLSNIFSILSLSFIFFILSFIISGGWITNDMIVSIENEAEISVYYEENANLSSIVTSINGIDGVREVSLIDKEEAQVRMTDIMGSESRIIELFDHNPFSPYIEVKIVLSSTDTVARVVEDIDGVELVRDNKEILDRLKSISSLVNILGILVVVAVSVATLVITSHIIRQGIYVNKEQINTLKLLGAPNVFINLPFILGGLLMTLLAGIISVGILSGVLKYIYAEITGSLPFLILPNIMDMIIGIGILSIVLSIVLGLLGSFFGLKSTKV